MPQLLRVGRLLSSAAGIHFPWEELPGGEAYAAWDFTTDQAIWNYAGVGGLANTPNWTFSRASTGYAATRAGVLTSFASGALRRTDKGVLIEGARTNLCLQSQTFDNASWTKTRSSISADATTAPDGTVTADKVVEDSSAASSHECSQSFTKAASALAYSLSVYAKAAERGWLCLTLYDNSSTGARYWFDLTNGVVGSTAAIGAGFTSVSATITTAANGFYRCTLMATSNTATALVAYAYVCNADASISYTGNGASGLYLWGAQLEQASFPSSYIPTTTASATRAADSLTVTGVSGIAYPLSLYAEFERTVDTGAIEALLCIDAGSSADRVRLDVSASDLGQIISAASSVTQATVAVAGSLAIGTSYKLAGRVSTNSVQAARGGTLGTEDTVATNPATPTTIRFGTSTSTGNECFGYLKRIAAFPRALTDAELQAITT